jgi:hypothetical protein
MLEDTRWVLALLLTVSAWAAFAEHPSARNLRRAVIDSLEL